MGYRDTESRDLPLEARLLEEKWAELCRSRGEKRYVEMIDRARFCYGRLFIPSEVLFVWNATEWIPSSDSDHYGSWEPVVSLLVQP